MIMMTEASALPMNEFEAITEWMKLREIIIDAFGAISPPLGYSVQRDPNIERDELLELCVLIPAYANPFDYIGHL